MSYQIGNILVINQKGFDMNANKEMNNAGGSVVINVDFAVAECILQDDSQWGLTVIGKRGNNPLCLKSDCLVIKKWLSSGIIPQSTDHFIAYVNAGFQSFLAYRIDREGEKDIRVFPIEFLSRQEKIHSLISLSIPGILAVCLAPIIWRSHERATKGRSYAYLESFCGYLQDRLRPLN